MATSQDFVNWVCSEELNERFLMYVLIAEKDSYSRFAHGTTHQTIYFPEVKAFHICLPPRAEQDRIVEVLGSLDDKINLNRRVNQTLEAMAQALFKSWFVDFEPVQAKAEGRQANGIDAEMAALFPGRLVESEIGEIPERWRVACLGEFLRNLREQVNPSDVARDTPYIGLEHMPRGSICLDNWESVEKVTSDKLAFHKGQILFGKLRPYFKKVGVALTDGVCSSDILVLDAAEADYFGWILGHLTRQEFIDFTSSVSSGTRMPRVSWEDMASFKVAVPPGGALPAAFNGQVQLFLERIERAVTESMTLRDLRDTLLPKLLSGEVRVGEAEAQLAASA